MPAFTWVGVITAGGTRVSLVVLTWLPSTVKAGVELVIPSLGIELQRRIRKDG